MRLHQTQIFRKPTLHLTVLSDSFEIRSIFHENWRCTLTTKNHELPTYTPKKYVNREWNACVNILIEFLQPLSWQDFHLKSTLLYLASPSFRYIHKCICMYVYTCVCMCMRVLSYIEAQNRNTSFSLFIRPLSLPPFRFFFYIFSPYTAAITTTSSALFIRRHRTIHVRS